ncbi:rhamnose mutarotase [Rhizopogon salebrosus TDB-379]|nr:rhamnose mutarotase [Rhizopogon salebrosus TDB-379]
MSAPHTKRLCQIIKLKPEFADEYKELHKNVWPSVLDTLRRYHIVDYSINYYPPLNLLIANSKYVGSDFEKDFKAFEEEEETQRWWKLTGKMRETLNDDVFVGPGMWTAVEEIFRFEG